MITAKNSLYLIFVFLCIKVHCEGSATEINNIKDYQVSLSNGFIGYKVFELIHKYCKSNNSNTKDKLRCNILLFLAKLNLKLESRIENRNTALSFSIRPFYFDYNHYYNPIGCISGYPGPHCILRRVGICGLGFGWEFYYNDINSKFKFSHNLTFFINVVAKKVIPFDILISYSPFVFSISDIIYLELSLINFSLGNFIKSIIMSCARLEKQHKDNWEKADSDDSETISEKNRYKEKVMSLHPSKSKKVKFILYDNLLSSMLYNIRLYIGIKH